MEEELLEVTEEEVILMVPISNISICITLMIYLSNSLEAKIHLKISLMMMMTSSVVNLDLDLIKACFITKWVEVWEAVTKSRASNLENNIMTHLITLTWEVE